MAYTPPPGNQIQFAFKGGYIVPPGDKIAFGFGGASTVFHVAIGYQPYDPALTNTFSQVFAKQNQ